MENYDLCKKITSPPTLLTIGPNLQNDAHEVDRLFRHPEECASAATPSTGYGQG